MKNSTETILVAVATPNRLGESPLWHPIEQVLYWCDIPAHRLYRLDTHTGAVQHWQFETDVACCAPMLNGGLLLAMRDHPLPHRPMNPARSASTTANAIHKGDFG
jgi:sugar lactone lactonase YvrE